MSTQTALVVTAIGQPIISTTWPIPQPGPRQVQLRVTVAALNSHDQKCRDDGLFISDSLPAALTTDVTSNSLPVILANDIAGVVTVVGPDVKKFKVGDRVFAYGAVFAPGNAQKGLQDYAVADEDFTARVPDGFTDHDVATLPVNISAAMVGLFDSDTLGIPAPWTEEARMFDYAGTQILIIGGGSNTGRFAVQLAKLAGIGKIVVLGGKEEELKNFGATHVLDRHGGDNVVQKRIRSVVGDDLVYCLDAVNPPESQYVGINALSDTKKGKYSRLVPSGPADTSKVIGKKAGYEILDTRGDPHWRPTTLCAPLYDRIEEYLVQGKIVPLPYVAEKGLDVAKVNEVLDQYRDGKHVGQMHFRISE